MQAELPGCHKVRRKLADGSYRAHYYAWRGGPKLDPDRLSESYHEAHRRRREAEDAAQSGSTVAGAMGWFKASQAHKGRSAKWKSTVERHHSLIVDIWGEDDISVFCDKEVRGEILALRDRFSATPTKADTIIKELTTFVNWLFDNGEISDHVVKRIGKLAKTNRAEVIWDADEIAFMQGYLTPDVFDAFEFSGYTGMDPCDLRKLTWRNVKEHSLDYAREKTGRIATPPLLDAARAVLDRRKARHVEIFGEAVLPGPDTLVFTSSDGKQYGETSLSSMFSLGKRKASAILPSIQCKNFKDMRGTAATHFAPFLDDDEMARCMGWEPEFCRRIRARYVDRDQLARATVERIRKDER